MKKTLVTFAILLLLIGSGCTQNTVIQGSTPNNKKETSSVSDFKYIEKEEGIIITEYVGTASKVILPAKIEERPVTQIGEGAFQYNRTITSVEIPNSVTHINRAAFSDCLALSSVSLPQGLTSVGISAFENCAKLSKITLPDTLTTLGDCAFKNCASLKYIKIPKGLTDWGSDTFLNAAIETVDFEEGIEKIGSSAFAYTDLKTLTLPKSVKKISTKAFIECKNLELVALNDGIITIGYRAFGGQSKLTELVIPASATDINEMFCDDNSSLRAIKFEGDAPKNYRTETTESFINPLKEYGYASYTVYYHKNATGFTSPEWCGYATAIW